MLFPFAGQSLELKEGARAWRLTRRQAQVIECLARGRCYKETAAELAISLSTVKMHVRSVFNKTGARNTLEAVHLLTMTV